MCGEFGEDSFVFFASSPLLFPRLSGLGLDLLRYTNLVFSLP